MAQRSFSFEDVAREAALLEFRLQPDEEGFYLRRPGSAVLNWFQDSERGRQEAYDWLQRRRVSVVRNDKVRAGAALSSPSMRERLPFVKRKPRFFLQEVPAGHVHQWQRLPESVGLFVCGDRGCLWCAVCPGCLGSLDVALRAHQGIDGLVLYWCRVHEVLAGVDDAEQDGRDA